MRSLELDECQDVVDFLPHFGCHPPCHICREGIWGGGLDDADWQQVPFSDGSRVETVDVGGGVQALYV